MQYLLTKEEYENLVSKEKYYAEKDKMEISSKISKKAMGE